MAKRVEQTQLQFTIEINGERKILKTIQEIKKERRTLIKQLETQSLTQAEYNKKIQELNKLNGVLSQHRKSVRGIAPEFKKASKSASGFSGVVKNIGASIKSALGPLALITAGITAFAELARSAFVAAEEVGKVKEQVNQLTGLVGKDLDQAAAKVVGLANTFQVDVQGGIDAANATAKSFIKEGQTLGDVYQVALDKMGDRLLGLPDKGQEFLDQIGEYSGVAAEAGLSIDRFFNIVSAGIQQGIPTDKLIDSVKEFDIRIKTITKGQKETLRQNLGQNFTDELIRNIESGKITSIDALDQISGKIGELGTDSAASKKIISDLFGGPGEDATGRYIALLDSVSGNLSDVVDESNIYIQRQREILQLETAAAQAASNLSFELDGSGNTFKKIGIQIKTFFSSAVVGVIQLIKRVPDTVKLSFNLALEKLNGFSSAAEGLINGILSQFGQEITLPKFNIEKSTDQLRKELQDRLASERAAFEKNETATRLLEEQTRQAGVNKIRAEEIRRRNEAEKAAVADATKAIEDLRLAVMEEGLEKEIALLQQKADREIEALKGNAEQKATAQALIEQRLAQETEQVRDKYRQQALKKEQEALKAEEKEKQLALQAEEQRQKAQLSEIDRYHQERQAIITQGVVDEIEAGSLVGDAEEVLRQRMLDELRRYLEARKEALEAAGEDTSALQQQLAQLDLDALTVATEDVSGKYDELYGKIAQGADIAGQAIGSLLDIQAAKSQQNYEDQLAQLEAQQDNALQSAGDNAEAREHIEKQFNQKRTKLETEYRKEQQKMAVKQALLDIASGTIKALATPPAPNIAAAGIFAGLGLLQLAALKAQQFEGGGVLPGRGGIPSGPTHRQGGVYLVNSRTGQVSGEIEGGEPIYSRAMYRNNRGLMDQLLHVSQHEGGRKLRPGEIRPLYATGGILDAPNTTLTEQTASSVSPNADIANLNASIAELTQAYREGKVILMGEREFALIKDGVNTLASDQQKRRLS